LLLHIGVKNERAMSVTLSIGSDAYGGEDVGLTWLTGVTMRLAPYTPTNLLVRLFRDTA